MMKQRKDILRYIAATAPLLADDTINSLKEFESANENLNDNEFYSALNNAFPWLDSHIQLMNAVRIKTKFDKIEKTTKSILSHLWFYSILIVLSILIGFLSLAIK